VTVAAVALIGVVLAVAVHSSSRNGVTDATAFDLPALGGASRVTLASYRGTPVVVNMFASWCTQYEAELPGFHDTAAKLAGKVQFVFVNSNETGDGTRMAERFHLFDFPVASDVGGNGGNGLYYSLGGTGGMPLTAFFGADGRFLGAVRGSLLGGDLADALDTIYGITV
jgi:thiol-disulfide isomerase/thioredoxin